jgi:indole-3-glycerol phosphate synthase
MDLLRQIMDERRAAVAEAKRLRPVAGLEQAAGQRVHHSLEERLRNRSGTAVVAEVKKASPSAGLLRSEYKPADLAREYARARAVGISVLTEPLHFQGEERHLREVRSAVDLPVLRKDFLCDAYQVVEAAAWGADVVLLIVAALDEPVLRALYEEALRWSLEVLVEAHTAGELDAALSLDRAILGVNSRNLKTLKTDLGVARALAERIPEGRLCIAESGIKTRSDVLSLESAGYDGFLIGETLLKAEYPGEKLKGLTT